MPKLEQYAGKTVLVTGASGFIGWRLCTQLQTLKAQVHAISRKQHIQDDGIIWHCVDLVDRQVCEQNFKSVRPDFVFHLASEVTGRRELNAMLPTFNSNLVSTLNLLVAASEHGCERIVLAGSLEEPDDNECPPIPSSPYAAAKWACSGYARMFYALYNTPVVISRIFMVYGPGQNDLLKLVPYVILSLLGGKAPKLSSGNRPIDWIYVDDVVNGLLLSGLSDNALGNRIDLGSGKLTTTRTVVETLCEIIGTNVKPEFGALPDRPLEQIRVAQVDDTAHKLAWRTEIGLRQGLSNTIDWYRKQLKAGHLG